jgi:hypothetical protein
MPKLVRFIYGPDIAERGSGPVLVEDVEARVLIADRRAELVDEGDLAEMPKAALVEVAEQVGADVHARDPKGQLVKVIAEGQ